MAAGRRRGSKVRLTPFGVSLYPQFKGMVGRITVRQVQTVGHGLAFGQRARYKVSYFVRWGDQKRDYLLASEVLRTV